MKYAILEGEQNVKWSQAVDEFMVWRQFSDYSARTERNNRSQLNWLPKLRYDIELDDLDHVYFRDFFYELGRTRADSTMNTMQATYSAFFRWLRTEGHMPPEWNPMKGMRYKKVQPKPKRRLSHEEFPAFLDAAPDPRHRIVVALGLYLMLRDSELRPLTVGDVDLQEGYIKVSIPKTKGYDEMPITADLDEELRLWLSHYAESLGTPLRDQYYLVPGVRAVKGKWATYEYYPMGQIAKTSTMIERVMVAYGWEDHKGHKLHALRRSGARQMYDRLASEGAGIDAAMEVTQASLHHRSRSMTEHYLGLEGSRAKRDKLLRGAHLFTPPTSDNVIPIRRIG